MTAGKGGRRTLTGKGRHDRNTEVDGTARAAAGWRGRRQTATFCRARPPPSVAVAASADSRRGRTLTGKGRHVRNTEVDGTARARAAAGRRGLRSSPARAQIVAGEGSDCRRPPPLVAAAAATTAGEGGS
jgi:hypothetical protein